ncbi:MAG: WG repeat-containing protein [Bacteroidales bacterium]|nr:WG repeat-containing protein [Bacteroidales bacterium]
MKKSKIAGRFLLVFTFLLLLFSVGAQEVPGPSKNSSGKWGYTSKAGTVVISYLYDDARTFSNDLAAVKKAGLWGYISVDGTVVVEPKYEDAWYFTNGLAAVKSYDKWGYINKKGEVMIPIEYEDAAEFVNSLAWVKKDGLIGYINTSGETVIPFQYKAAVSFSKSYALAYYETGWGVIDNKGTPMAGTATFVFDDARPFEDDMAPVYSKSAGKWGLVGTDGKLKVDFEFSSPTIDKTTSAFTWAYAAASYNNSDKINLAKQIRLGTVGIGVRYNTYDQYHDRVRFSAMVYDNPDSTLVYNGSEYSLMFKFMNKRDISRGYKGYGFAGQYYGFELRYADLQCNPIYSEVYDENYMLVAQTNISPIIKRYDAAMLIGYSSSRKLFFWDIGMSIGVGYKDHDFGDYGKTGYTYSDERLTEGWTKVYLVNRYYLRFGINLF